MLNGDDWRLGHNINWYHDDDDDDDLTKKINVAG